MAQAVEEWYKQMPIITRSYLTAAIVTAVGCSLEIISPHNLYLNPKLVMKRYEFWRLVTNFLYFRKMDLNFLFHMFFLARYCKLLEENTFRGRTADFFTCFYLQFFDIYDGLCMEQAKLVYPCEFLGTLYFHGSLSSMGSFGFLYPSQGEALGRSSGNDCGSCLLFS
ncbi:hypothetical protein Nepgr_007160 [Nepenthes gracilis]|uniref:Derlin n=1 Tax=Nepenthes gracilis TaxID=150966 RepID=A0AAD3S6F9_NEPGR|nr:hypothetical protein Nepgr_007160 [Nepenthes gracilis]